MDSIKIIKDKCAQYWNEPGIGDAEIHSILEFIYDEANVALRELATLETAAARKDVEIEAWRSGRLGHNGNPEDGLVVCRGEYYDTADEAVDALMREEDQ